MKGKRMTTDELLQLFSSEAELLLLRHGEDAETARRGSGAFITRLSNVIGGLQTYVPKFVSGQKAEAVNNDFKSCSDTIREIAPRHGITAVNAYQIIKKSNGITTNKITHPLVLAVAVEGARLLIEHGVEPTDAAQAARGFATVLLTRLSGRYIYIPKREHMKSRAKYPEIVKRYKAGVPIADIAAQFGLTIARVGQIIKEQGEISPRQRRTAMTLSRLKKSILEASVTYRKTQPNEEIYGLLMTAAEAVDQARTIATGNNPPKRSEPQ